jgi:hypothetical protein
MSKSKEVPNPLDAPEPEAPKVDPAVETLKAELAALKAELAAREAPPAQGLSAVVHGVESKPRAVTEMGSTMRIDY